MINELEGFFKIRYTSHRCIFLVLINIARYLSGRPRSAVEMSALYRNSVYTWILVHAKTVQLDYSFYDNPCIDQLEVFGKVIHNTNVNLAVRRQLLYMLIEILLQTKDYSDISNVIKLGIFLIYTSPDLQLQILKETDKNTIKLWWRKINGATDQVAVSKSLEALELELNQEKLNDSLLVPPESLPANDSSGDSSTEGSSRKKKNIKSLRKHSGSMLSLGSYPIFGQISPRSKKKAISSYDTSSSDSKCSSTSSSPSGRSVIVGRSSDQ